MILFNDKIINEQLVTKITKIGYNNIINREKSTYLIRFCFVNNSVCDIEYNNEENRDKDFKNLIDNICLPYNPFDL